MINNFIGKITKATGPKYCKGMSWTVSSEYHFIWGLLLVQLHLLMDQRDFKEMLLYLYFVKNSSFESVGRPWKERDWKHWANIVMTGPCVNHTNVITITFVLRSGHLITLGVHAAFGYCTSSVRRAPFVAWIRSCRVYIGFLLRVQKTF